MSNLQTYTYSYNQKSNSKILTIIVHGGSAGIDSDFIQKIKNKYNSNSTLLIQMPFIDRQEEVTSFPEFVEEITEFEEIIKTIDMRLITTINFVGKSIGGLVLLNYIYKHYQELIKYKIKLTFLGYLLEYTILDISKPLRIDIIQGSNDKYGKIEDLKVLTKNFANIEVKIVEDGDHSYRDNNRNPIYQDLAISLLD